MRYRSSKAGRKWNPPTKYVNAADVAKRVKSIRGRIRAAVKAQEAEGSAMNPKWIAVRNAVFDLERDAWSSEVPSDFGYLQEEITQGQAEGARLRSEPNPPDVTFGPR